MDDLNKKLAKPIRHFWVTRDAQSTRQGQLTGQRDAGLHTAVTGGKHLHGFVDLCRELIVESGIRAPEVFSARRMELPGYFRPEKNRDLVVVSQGHLVAVLEFKAQVGPSFGNNFNNRTEEALGNATDLWAAYREGAFKPSQRPWLGYVFLLEDCVRSQTPVRTKVPHFKVFPEFQNASYAKRYEIMLMKLMRERLYDGVGLILTDRKGGLKGKFTCPNEELDFRVFATSLMAHAASFAKLNY